MITLKCAAEGFPSNSTVVTNSFGISPQRKLVKRTDLFRMETLVVVQDIEEEDYVCLVETHYKGYSVANEKQSLKINLYSELQ